MDIFIRSENMATGLIKCSAPSNIALVKYWGKRGQQLPCNPSVSFTLDQSRTQCTLRWKKLERQLNTVSFDFLFYGEKKISFEPKIQKLLEFAIELASNQGKEKLLGHHLTIETNNNFPHSTGIASSASSMAALSMALSAFLEPQCDEKKFKQFNSQLARLGSGSACRSIFPYAALWGECPGVKNSTDLFAVEIEVHPVFKTYCDTVLIVSEDKKEVSSSVGHELMNNHPYASARFEIAKKRCISAVTLLKNGEIEDLHKLIEAEALDLHAMMMTSPKNFILMRPQSLAIIQKIRDFRTTTKVPLCFTLDAGPNVHVLYPENEKKRVLDFIQSELTPFCQSQKMIHDQVGIGPRWEKE